MEKNEKLKLLEAVAKGLDLTAEEVIRYLGGVSAMTEKAKLTFIARPGMYYYSDGTVTDKLLNKQISGVVGWVDETGRHGLVVGLREEALAWSNQVSQCSDSDSAVLSWRESGKGNTRLILDKVRENKDHAPAAEWCAMYDYDGVQSGDAFLPSQSEWLKVYPNLRAIQKTLKKLGKPLRLYMDYHYIGEFYWTSTETKNYCEAVVVSLRSGSCSSEDKGYKRLVRCFFAF